MTRIPDSGWKARAHAWTRHAFKAWRLGRFLGYAVRRFLADGCPLQAAGLSYVSLLAIVPLLAIGLAVIARLPALESWRGDIQAFVIGILVPEAGAEAGVQLEAFVENASRMTGPGLVVLALAAILLMANVGNALNTIWRAAEARPLALRLAAYWATLILGPLFIGASLSVSGYAFTAVQWFGIDPAALEFLGASRLFSFTLAALGFAFLYFVVPNRPVRPHHALIGGLVAAAFFELLKAAFGLYLNYFPAYEVIYGALAAIPVFLLWMYLTWVAALFGAEITAALPEWRTAQARGRTVAGPGAHLALALSLLGRLREARNTGVKVFERRLGRDLPATPAEIDATLRRLRRAGVVARTLRGHCVLVRDLSGISLAALAEVLDLGLDPGAGWDPAAEGVAKELAAAGADRMTRSIEAVLGEFDAGGP